MEWNEEPLRKEEARTDVREGGKNGSGVERRLRRNEEYVVVGETTGTMGRFRGKRGSTRWEWRQDVEVGVCICTKEA
jgi:hypothetical protein